MADALILLSPLPRADCVARLRATLADKDSGLVGRVDEDSLRLQRAKSPWTRRLGAWRRLVAEMEDAGGGTRLRVWIRPSWELLIFAFIGVAFLGRATADTGSLAPLLLLAAAMLGLVVGWAMSEPEGAGYLDLLREILQATPPR